MTTLLDTLSISGRQKRTILAIDLDRSMPTAKLTVAQARALVAAYDATSEEQRSELGDEQRQVVEALVADMRSFILGD